MKILLISDTHRQSIAIPALLEKYKNEIGMLCHMGDGCMDVNQYASLYPNIKMVAAKGNTDYDAPNKEDYMIELNNFINPVQIFVTHGHSYGVKRGLGSLYRACIDKKVQACFFGHTHERVVFIQDGILYLNPGSFAFPYRSGLYTYGFAEITPEGKINGELREDDLK